MYAMLTEDIFNLAAIRRRIHAADLIKHLGPNSAGLMRTRC